MIGRVLDGRYVLSRLLGRGGMGVVYLARQLDPPRDVVVKLISPVLRDDREIATRFEREALRLQELQHANIVRFYGCGHDGDLHYLVMEYVDGEALSELLARRRRLALDEFVPIAAQILKGVGYAHSRDVLLRDIKPSNIMLCVRGDRASFVKLLDFGLAKVLEAEPAITSQQVLGTAGYIAPEMLRNDPVDLRADVYALGVLAYEMLAGRQPFEGAERIAIVSQTLHEQPAPLASLIPEGSVPAGLCELIHQCLEKDPERRPADANAMVEQLIDVVPATLFRLPRADRRGSYPSGAWNTATDSTSRTPPPAPSVARPVEADERTTSGRAAAIVRTGPRPRSIAVAATGFALVVGVGGWAMLGDRRAPIIAPATGEAATMQVEGPPIVVPDQKAIAARLHEAELALASEQPDAAIDAYLDVLALAPADASARAGLERARAASRLRPPSTTPQSDIAVPASDDELPTILADPPVLAADRAPRAPRTGARTNKRAGVLDVAPPRTSQPETLADDPPHTRDNDGLLPID